MKTGKDAPFFGDDMRGRPVKIRDDDIVYLNTINAKCGLKQWSEVRAVVNYIIDAGGRATIRDMNDYFGFHVRNRVMTLASSGWVKVERKDEENN